MLRVLAAFIGVGVLFTASPADHTEWLAAGHPRVDIMFDRTLKPDCQADCERYAMLLRYQSSAPPTVTEISEWTSFADAGCVDLLMGGKTTFTCRLPGTIARNSKDGRHIAMSRFHMTKAQLQELATPAASMRIANLTLQLPAATRAALQAFVEQTGKAVVSQ